MKTKYLKNVIACTFLAGITLISCSKKSSDNASTTSISGSWVTNVWGGSNDTAKMNISGSTGTLTYLNTGAMTTGFSVNDVIFTNITSAGSGTYTANAIYRYNAGGGSGNSTVGHTTATLSLENSNTVLFAHYATDASSGITPPDYYWTKQ